jgi:hypothetical protein
MKYRKELMDTSSVKPKRSTEDTPVTHDMAQATTTRNPSR